MRAHSLARLPYVVRIRDLSHNLDYMERIRFCNDGVDNHVLDNCNVV